MLTEVQAAMEEHRDASQTKLVLCGSLVSQMQSLLEASSPLHGRLRRLDVWPLTFAESRGMTSPDDTAEQRIIRFAVAGGMARYLSELGHGPLREVVCASVLDHRSQVERQLGALQLQLLGEMLSAGRRIGECFENGEVRGRTAQFLLQHGPVGHRTTAGFPAELRNAADVDHLVRLVDLEKLVDELDRF